jgi:hypothetical protein
MVEYKCGDPKAVVLSKADLADWTSLLQNDDYGVLGQSLRNCFKKYWDRGINTYQFVTQEFCDFEFLYVSQNRYFPKYFDCMANKRDGAPNYDYQTCLDVWAENKEKEIKMVYDDSVAFTSLKGHCRSS